VTGIAGVAITIAVALLYGSLEANAVQSVLLSLVTESRATGTARLQGSSVSASNASMVSWVGRRKAAGGSMFLDYEGVAATVSLTGFTWLTVDISDQCAGSASLGGGSRWSVDMNASAPYVAEANHRIQTFYSGPQVCAHSSCTASCHRTAGSEPSRPSRSFKIHVAVGTVHRAVAGAYVPPVLQPRWRLRPALHAGRCHVHVDPPDGVTDQRLLRL
jgi:hypothetical protein